MPLPVDPRSSHLSKCDAICPLLAPSPPAWSSSAACKLEPCFLSRGMKACLGHAPPCLRPSQGCTTPGRIRGPQWSGCHLPHLHSHFSPDALTSLLFLECAHQVSISELFTCCSSYGKSPFPSFPSAFRSQPRVTSQSRASTPVERTSACSYFASHHLLFPSQDSALISHDSVGVLAA